MRHITITLILCLTACGSYSETESASVGLGGICLMGDSITAAWPESLLPQGAYNRGISGNTTLDVIGRLWSVGLEKPSALQLMIGINDLSMGYSPESVAINVGIIVDEIQRISAGTIITVVGILPAAPIDYNTIITANEGIEDIITAYSDVYFIGTLHLEVETYDGVHPTYGGYLTLRETVFIRGVE